MALAASLLTCHKGFVVIRRRTQDTKFENGDNNDDSNDNNNDSNNDDKDGDVTILGCFKSILVAKFHVPKSSPNILQLFGIFRKM